MTTEEELVSVIVPAYNAAQTLAETLASVSRQTYLNLEIIVVDDGSTDDTVAVAGAYAATDARVRVLSIENGGVAVARNAGIAASRGSFVAPVDADDLWHSEKIFKQMAEMHNAGPDTGFVYTLDRKIDSEGRVIRSRGESAFEGLVYLRHLLFNFVGNGSSLLIRRAALEEVGGYERDLHRRGAQGCEDYLLQLSISRSWRVGLVKEYLTGYRVREGSMSSDRERMARSRFVMLELISSRFPETPRDLLAASEAMVRAKIAVHLLHRKRLGDAFRELRTAASLDLGAALDAGLTATRDTLRGILERRRARYAPAKTGFRPLFYTMDASSNRQPAQRPLLSRRFARLAGHESVFFSARSGASLRHAADDGSACATLVQQWT